MYGTHAQQLFDELQKHGIIGATGRISVELLNVECDVNEKSAVGDLLQEWLGAWMTEVGFYHRTGPNTQEFPDFYLGETDTADLLEVKSFNFNATPAFDVANFDAYVRSVTEKAYRIDADYLIFGYTLTEHGLKVEQVWLKKIWEITCPSEAYALKTQNKQSKIINIRPYDFKNMSRGFQPFANRREFVEAIRLTLASYPMRTMPAQDWIEAVQTSYTGTRPGSSL
ncbi:NgoBV family restriction endonuclease [Candidatus Saccharibacteria bacterium]|nr:NgoBV family restriction endonuclease [Candidatus Saccharibacteria bacterium]